MNDLSVPDIHTHMGAFALPVTYNVSGLNLTVVDASARRTVLPGYSTPDGYVVELSFSDLGPMDRRDFALEGRVTLHRILSEAIGATALSGYSLKSATMVNDWSTGEQTALNLSRLCISADNFYDDKRRRCAGGRLNALDRDNGERRH